MTVDMHELRALTPPAGMPFKIQRLGHVVLQVSNLDRSMRFYASEWKGGKTLEAAIADPVIGQDTVIAQSVNYDLRKDTGRVYGDTTKRPARGRR
jgi:hypothetical protein